MFSKAASYSYMCFSLYLLSVHLYMSVLTFLLRQKCFDCWHTWDTLVFWISRFLLKAEDCVDVAYHVFLIWFSESNDQLYSGSWNNEIVFSAVDALDYTEKWLEDTARCMREAETDGSNAASSDPPSLLPLNVHNQAYLRLLRWNHASDPFPEVNPINAEDLLYLLFFMNCLSCFSSLLVHMKNIPFLLLYRLCWWIRFAFRRCSRRPSC